MEKKVNIGLEIHLQLATQSKMFCSCENPKFDTPANTSVCPICLGLPGTLPTLNEKAVEMALILGLALNGEVQKRSYFERKNYFYPDLPKGYQISQKSAPLIKNAFLEINNRKIRIREIHLEEDTAKIYHFSDKILLDFNRAGLPLLELVTEPDLFSAQEAKEFCQELQTIIRYLKISEANMEKGEMRCEVNISVSQKSKVKTQKLGTKVEIKNLNSFRAIERSIEYEIKRQEEILEKGGEIQHETRGWDETKQKTVQQRLKEEVEDYRYFPEPDLPLLELTDYQINEIKKSLPELPLVKRKRFIEEYKFSPPYAKILTQEQDFSFFVERVMDLLYEKLKEEIEELEIYKEKIAKKVGDWLINRLFSLDKREQLILKIKNEELTPENFSSFIFLIVKNKIPSKIAQDILREIYQTGKSPEEVLSQEKIKTEEPSEEELKETINLVLENYPEAVSDYKKGKKAAIKYLIGQVMAATRGRADPKILEKLLKKFLKS
ncbi:MAG: Asp-tRNA(Asn)/Glu-tRNA(Gln) amidotransferase subunit GatB [Patescibacteria group bacterium]|nr:Asp-tRNA(Asn)/Glu-tRNA(Gln) amidotransferase subunit GatB [Patescibacteria group bacterium]